MSVHTLELLIHTDMHEECWQGSEPEIESAPFLPPNSSSNFTQQSALGKLEFRLKKNPLHYIVSLQCIILLCIATYAAYVRASRGSTSQLLLKGPSVDYEIRSFSWGFGEDTPVYQQKSSEVVDNAWKSLYSTASGEQSTHTPAVFHNLECLDAIRQELGTDMYHPNKTESRGVVNNSTYLTHCIETLRQSLMCMADISVIVWQWIPEANEATIRMDVAHTCRKFDQAKTLANLARE